MTDEMPGTATSRSVKADQIAYKYGCFLQPGAFGRVHLVDDPRRNGQESWLTRLLDDERGAVVLIESDAWNWDSDCASDEQGGHAPFPLAAPTLAEKLQTFRDGIV